MTDNRKSPFEWKGLLVDSRLGMFYSGMLYGCYAPRIPRAAFSRATMAASDGKITRDDMEFISSFSKDSSGGHEEFCKSAISELVEKNGGGALLRLMAALEPEFGSVPLSVLFHDADLWYSWHVSKNGGYWTVREDSWIENSKAKWAAFSESLVVAMWEAGISEFGFCEISGEEPSGEGYGKTVLNHLKKSSSFGRNSKGDCDGRCKAFSEALGAIRDGRFAKSFAGAVSGAIAGWARTVADAFLELHAGEAVSSAYRELAGFGESPELMGNSPKFCTSLLRDLSSRKALGRVLSATVLGRADTEAELSGPELAEAVSKVISEKRGEVTVETNLLSGDALAAVVKEYARELSEEIDGSEASELVGFADFKKELIPGFTDSDALAESMVGRIVPGTPEFAKAMLFFAGRFLVSKNRVSQYNGSEGTIQ